MEAFPNEKGAQQEGKGTDAVGVRSPVSPAKLSFNSLVKSNPLSPPKAQKEKLFSAEDETMDALRTNLENAEKRAREAKKRAINRVTSLSSSSGLTSSPSASGHFSVRIAELKKSLHATEEQKASVEEQLRWAQKQLGDLHSQSDSVSNKKITDLLLEMSKVEQKSEMSVKQVEMEKETLKSRCDVLKSQLDSSVGQRDALQACIMSLKKQLAESRQVHADEATNSSDRCNALKSQNKTLVEELAQLRTAHEEASKALQEKSEQCETHEKTISRLSSDLRVSAKNLQRAQNRCSEIAESVNTLETERARWLSVREKHEHALHKEKLRSSQELSQLSSKVAALETQATTATVGMERAIAAQDILAAKLESTAMQLEYAKSELHQSRERNVALDNAYAKASHTIKVLEQQVDDMHLSRDEAVTKAQQTTRQITRARSAFKALHGAATKQRECLGLSCEDWEARFLHELERREEVDLAYLELEQSRTDLESKFVELASVLTQVRGEVQSLEAELVETQESLRAEQDVSEAARDRVEQLEEELSDAQEESRREMEQLQASCRDLEGVVEETQLHLVTVEEEGRRKVQRLEEKLAAAIVKETATAADCADSVELAMKERAKFEGERDWAVAEAVRLQQMLDLAAPKAAENLEKTLLEQEAPSLEAIDKQLAWHSAEIHRLCTLDDALVAMEKGLGPGEAEPSEAASEAREAHEKGRLFQLLMQHEMVLEQRDELMDRVVAMQADLERVTKKCHSTVEQLADSYTQLESHAQSESEMSKKLLFFADQEVELRKELENLEDELKEKENIYQELKAQVVSILKRHEDFEALKKANGDQEQTMILLQERCTSLEKEVANCEKTVHTSQLQVDAAHEEVEQLRQLCEDLRQAAKDADDSCRAVASELGVATERENEIRSRFTAMAIELEELKAAKATSVTEEEGEKEKKKGEEPEPAPVVEKEDAAEMNPAEQLKMAKKMVLAAKHASANAEKQLLPALRTVERHRSMPHRMPSHLKLPQLQFLLAQGIHQSGMLLQRQMGLAVQYQGRAHAKDLAIRVDSLIKESCETLRKLHDQVSAMAASETKLPEPSADVRRPGSPLKPRETPSADPTKENNSRRLKYQLDIAVKEADRYKSALQVVLHTLKEARAKLLQNDRDKAVLRNATEKLSAFLKAADDTFLHEYGAVARHVSRLREGLNLRKVRFARAASAPRTEQNSAEERLLREAVTKTVSPKLKTVVMPTVPLSADASQRLPPRHTLSMRFANRTPGSTGKRLTRSASHYDPVPRISFNSPERIDDHVVLDMDGSEDEDEEEVHVVEFLGRVQNPKLNPPVVMEVEEEAVEEEEDTAAPALEEALFG